MLRYNPAVLDHDAGDFTGDLSAVGGHGVLLTVHGFPDDDEAVLDEGGAGAKDEVNGAGDDAVAVEVAVGLGVEGVLVTVHAAVVEGGPVGLDAEGHGLVALWPGCVLEAHSLCYEPISNCTYPTTYLKTIQLKNKFFFHE